MISNANCTIIILLLTSAFRHCTLDSSGLSILCQQSECWEPILEEKCT